MLIDWFTVGAQMVNFLLLIVLLQRFLYRPLLAALARREQGIREQLANADQARKQAETEAKALARERETLATNKENLLAAAHSEAAAFKETELARARAEVATKKEQWLTRLGEEEQSFLHRVRLKVGELAFQLSRKVLRDLSGVELEQQLLEELLARDGLLPAPATDQPVAQVTVRSGFPLSEEARRGITEKLATGSPGLTPDFEVDSGLGFGIELIIGDHKTVWNLNRYLQDIEAEAQTLLRTPQREKPHDR